ncbi:hypothetical protein I5677_05620 [Mobilitalea sibirica]|uniref:YbbR domain-containing protein n=1 Tax=Mobilitalea sibirica TaxID=1462919 RepID=A0A8J7GY84_9FIRM|nr:CdaR family protein [Mobilitalea sibirica]MBH1940374.1 hypothetical protein [Mobilitalea sibirica]
MKDKLTRNIGLKILSILLASVLWLVITNVDDPVVPKEFRNVEVEIINEDAIHALNEEYEVIEGDTIDFTVRARRSIRDELTEDDFVVTADFENLSVVDSVPISITCPKYKGEVEITEGLPKHMKISREELVDKTVKVDVIAKGEPAEGYVVGETSVSPIFITVTGPKARVDRISKVVAEADVTGASRTFTRISEPIALDEEGNPIESKLDYSEKNLFVSIDLYRKKMINVLLNITGEPAEGYVQTEQKYEPEVITIAAEESILADIKYLPITEDITGASSSIEKQINLLDALPEGENIIIVDEDKTVAISITIEKMESTEVSIWPRDIDIKNLSSSLDLDFITTGPIRVKVMGPKDLITELTRQNLNPYINMAGYSSGTYTMEIKTDLPNSVIYDTPKVRVNVER